MGDREQPVGNRLIAVKRAEQRYQTHVQALREVKKVIEVEPPEHYSHLEDRQKKQHRVMDRQAVIERDNLVLLEKLQRIVTSPKRRLYEEPFMLDSLSKGSLRNRIIVTS